MTRLKRRVPLSKKLKYMLFVIITGLLFTISFVGRGSFLSIYRNRIKANQNKEQYQELLVKIDETDAEINRFLNDDEYLVKYAREEFGMQRKDEHVIKLIEADQ
ncbi:septum formation initiator family protein [bacterium]|nr:septum formation initiator family protein [bacterium]